MHLRRRLESGAERQGLSNPHCHDTTLAIRVTVEAIRLLIKEDKVKLSSEGVFDSQGLPQRSEGTEL